MAVFDRSELQASSLADLHAIADQLGLEGFRRLRKADLIDLILAGPAAGGAPETGAAGPAEIESGDGPDGEGPREPSAEERPRRRPSLRGRRARRPSTRDGEERQADERAGSDDGGARAGEPARAEAAGRAEEIGRAEGIGRGEGAGDEARAGGEEALGELDRQVGDGQAGEGRPRRGERPARRARASRGERAAGEERTPRAGRRSEAESAAGSEPLAEGVVELLGNGSAFLRVHPPEASDEDIYISAAQVRRCELVGGDRVSGPVRAPRRSERYSSLIRVETINGAPAGEVSEGARYEDRPVAYPSERFALEGGDATLRAIEWLTPFGRGSRVIIAGPARAGKTEILRRLLGVLAGREGLEITVVLAGVRPEEVAEWSDGPVAPATQLTFAASADTQGQAVEHAVETAKRTAARGGDALVLIDALDGLHPHVARRVMAAARNLGDGGSLTILATATRPLGGETTVIALDPSLTDAGGPPLDLAASGTVRAELLVGEDGAAAIAKARASALESAG